MYRALVILAVLMGSAFPAHAADYGDGSGIGVLIRGIGLLIVVVIAGLLYFLPSVCAFRRGHHQRGPILALNILAGWTAIGWVAAFVWAFTAVHPQIRT